MIGKPLLALAALAMLGSAAASQLPTSVLSVAPLLVDVDSRSSNALLRLTNGSDRTMAVEMTVFRWDQPEGEDRLVATDAVAISPAITRISAGGQRVVRLLFLDPRAGAGNEQSYRVIVEEMPDASVARNGPQMRLRLSIPMFRDGDVMKPPLTAQFRSGELIVRNDGGRRLRLIDPRLQSAGGNGSGLTSVGPAYILAGQSRRFRLTEGQHCPAADARLLAASDMGPVDVAVAGCSD